MKTPEEREDIIKAEFERANIFLKPKDIRKFVLLDELLEIKNKDSDLTRITNHQTIVVNHYVDSVKAANLMSPPGGVLMDLGTGAGFPGLPIAIMKPGWKLLLAEPRLKKLAFMEEVVNLLELKNVEFYPHKVGPRSRPDIHSIISRDFASVSETMALVLPMLPQGGKLFLMKAASIRKELEEAERVEEYKHYALRDNKNYDLIAFGVKRMVLTFEKISDKENKDPEAPDPSWSVPSKNFKKITEIASSVNSTYKGWIQLLSGGMVKKKGETLIYGKKIIKDMILKYPDQIRCVIAKKIDDLEGFDFSPDTPVCLLRREIFPNLDIFGTGPPIVLAGIRDLPPWDPQKPLETLTLFAPIQDPLNVGAIVRTAAAMGTDLVLLEEAANPFHPKAVRAAGPSVYGARIFKGPSLPELSRLNLPYLKALSPKGKDIYTLDPENESLGLVLGLEGPGLDSYWPESKRVSIPMKGGVDSLNVTVAAAMAIAVLQRRF
jgi:16S rRNA (guanine527-N7)-methyltransferase